MENDPHRRPKFKTEAARIAAWLAEQDRWQAKFAAEMASAAAVIDHEEIRAMGLTLGPVIQRTSVNCGPVIAAFTRQQDQMRAFGAAVAAAMPDMTWLTKVASQVVLDGATLPAVPFTADMMVNLITGPATAPAIGSTTGAEPQAEPGADVVRIVLAFIVLAIAVWYLQHATVAAAEQVPGVVAEGVQISWQLLGGIGDVRQLEGAAIIATIGGCRHRKS